MTTPSHAGIDPIRTRLRYTVSAVERELSLLTRDPSTDRAGARSLEGLLACWVDLVTQLNLGPEPDSIDCPHCGHVVMRAARLCGNCWKKLTPPPAETSPAV